MADSYVDSKRDMNIHAVSNKGVGMNDTIRIHILIWSKLEKWIAMGRIKSIFHLNWMCLKMDDQYL